MGILGRKVYVLVDYLFLGKKGITLRLNIRAGKGSKRKGGIRMRGQANKKEPIRKRAYDGKKQTGKKKRIWWMILWIMSIAILFTGGGAYLLSEKLEVTFYHLYSAKMTGSANVRLAILADMHNREFGSGNGELVRQIQALQPDLILVAGDMVNSHEENLDIILNLCSQLTKIAPVYYSPGNHEDYLMYEKAVPLEQLLMDQGVHVLVNRAETITMQNTVFSIGGLTTSEEGYEEYGAEFMEEYEKGQGFKLLISHYPSLYYEKLADKEVDLGVCGHYHGGQIRLPLLGGLYHGDTGFFPKYNGGMYKLPYSTLLVSRGMGGQDEGVEKVTEAIIDINGRPET